MDDILLVRDMRVAMCGAGPFVPQADTPLGRQPRGSTELCLRVMAVLRLALPWANLPATTALVPRPEVVSGGAPQAGGTRAHAFLHPAARSPTTASTTTRLWWTWTPCDAPLRAQGWSMRCRKLRQGGMQFLTGEEGRFW